MDKEEIQNLMKANLRNSFVLFNENHKVNVHILEPQNICIGYRTGAEGRSQWGYTHFDIEIINDTCYILNIELERDNRGRGIGWSLYEAIHQFARDFGVKRVIQTPSGWTPKGKTRREYLLERGYAPFGEDELELMLVDR